MTPSSPTRARLIWTAVALGALAAGVALYLFQPWLLFLDKTANEALPSYEVPGATATATPVTSAPPEPHNVLLATGTFISHEHDSSGSAHLIELADGRVQLAIENLATSLGPDVQVWLTDQPVIEGQAGWHVFDDGRHVSLGELRADHGNLVYDVPPGTDLTGLISVSLWCAQYSVSFGAAPLNPV